jgi:hypothetical protein
MSSEKKTLEDYLTLSQSAVETLFDTLKSREGREISTLEKSLEYWSLGKGSEMLDYLYERCRLGIGKKEDLEVHLSDNLRFNIEQRGISYSICGFEKEAKGDINFMLTDEKDAPSEFVVTAYDPETETFTTYEALANLLTLIIDEGVKSSELNDKLNNHVINILGGEYPINLNPDKEKLITRLSEPLDYNIRKCILEENLNELSLNFEKGLSKKKYRILPDEDKL